MLNAEREAARQCCLWECKIYNSRPLHISLLDVAIYMQLTELLSLESICPRWARVMHVWMIPRLLI